MNWSDLAWFSAMPLAMLLIVGGMVLYWRGQDIRAWLHERDLRRHPGE